ncbi:MAG: hypothetical protein A2284_03980 [Deltaproteobacteria bacterium RIFOXYA12_FULL_61_11]|nr:MAG: hypothetical protein A2284_03980 [Deltaproteobacteria bacterium RIFOXYA12_FULL_61_11]
MKACTSLSIVIPVLDEERSLPSLFQDLDALLADHASIDWELIFVDDGSTDHSGSLLEQYAAGRPHAKVLHQPGNTGMGCAVLCGFDQASHEFLTLLPADGQIAPRQLEVLLPVLGTADLVLTTYRSQHRGLLRPALSSLFSRLIARLVHPLVTYQGIFVLRHSDYLLLPRPRSHSFFAFFELLDSLLLAHPDLTIHRIGITCSPRSHGTSRVTSPRRMLVLALELFYHRRQQADTAKARYSSPRCRVPPTAQQVDEPAKET